MHPQTHDSSRRQKGLSPDVRFGVAAYGLLALVLVASTWIHHFEPHVLRVPRNGDVSSWRSPAFEETLLHEHATPGEREKILAEGVVLKDRYDLQAAGDVFALFMGWICFLHALRHYGFWKASCFLVGSFVFTGLEETIWILSGRFLGGRVENPLGETFFGTYWFTRGIVWFLETPLTACMGWFFIAYACVLTAGKVFPRMGLWGRAAAGGLIAMGIDLWIDPVQTAPEVMSWVWAKGDPLLLFGIPQYNFVGWFLLIFLFAIFWEALPGLEASRGRTGASVRFFGLVLAVPFAVFAVIWLWIYLLGGILSLVGVQGAMRIPRGW